MYSAPEQFAFGTTRTQTIRGQFEETYVSLYIVKRIYTYIQYTLIYMIYIFVEGVGGFIFEAADSRLFVYLFEALISIQVFSRSLRINLPRCLRRVCPTDITRRLKQLCFGLYA